jgi:hypothetical protein
MPSWTSRVTCGLAAIAIGCMFLAVGLRRETVECDRSADLCRISSDYPGYRRTDAVRISDIVEHLHEPRSRGRAQIVLVDRAGERRVIALAMADVTAPRFAALDTFLGGDAPHLAFVTGPWRAAIWAGVLVLFLSPIAFYRGWRRR